MSLALRFFSADSAWTVQNAIFSKQNDLISNLVNQPFKNFKFLVFVFKKLFFFAM